MRWPRWPRLRRSSTRRPCGRPRLLHGVNATAWPLVDAARRARLCHPHRLRGHAHVARRRGGPREWRVGASRAGAAGVGTRANNTCHPERSEGAEAAPWLLRFAQDDNREPGAPSMLNVVGQSVPRKDGIGKATGQARYTDDLHFPGMLVGRTVRTTIPCGHLSGVRSRLRSRRLHPGGPPRHPRPKRRRPDRRRPALPGRARDSARRRAGAAARAREPRGSLGATVTLDQVAEPPVFDPEASPTAFKTILIEKGDLATGFAGSDHIVEGTYRTGHQEHVYIEPKGVIAVPEGGGMTVYGSIQCPFYAHRALATVLGDAVSSRAGGPDGDGRRVRREGGVSVRHRGPRGAARAEVGPAGQAGLRPRGGHGRHDEAPSGDRPPPHRGHARRPARRDGHRGDPRRRRLHDALSPSCSRAGAIHAAGPYRCDNIRIAARAMLTNTPPNGAFRGFGAPQTQFAVEVHMERIAEALGMDPVRLRELNVLRPGDTTATGQRLGEDCSALEVLRDGGASLGLPAQAQGATRAPNRRHRAVAVLSRLGIHRQRRGEARVARRSSSPPPARGSASSTEIGQGTRTMHAQIVADTLGVPYEQVEVAAADTGVVPDSGPTVASRTCMVVGRILQRAAEEMRAEAGRPHARRVLPAARPAVGHEAVRAAGLDPVGRRQLSRRCLRHLRLGLRRRRGRGRSRHLGGAAARVHGRARDRQGDPSRARARTDRGRHARRDSATRCSSTW